MTGYEEERLDEKGIELVEMMINSLALNLPTKVSTRTMNIIKNQGLTDKKSLRDSLVNCQFKVAGRAGTEKTIAEACWYVVYGEDTQQ